MKITREFAIRHFRKHWRYLARTGNSDKNKYMEYKGLRVKNGCYLCEFAGMDGCSFCPIDWPDLGANEVYKSPCMRSYYILWIRTSDPEERSRLAEIIANLKEKEPQSTTERRNI